MPTSASLTLATVLRNHLYYQVKPFIPRAIRLGVRRRHSLRLRERVGDFWPIMPGSERPPTGWPGWPGGKKFALVLTHDVESARGVQNCPQLLQLEQRLGFRSSFNFVPEGDYRVPPELRAELVAAGCEVGLHDLNHDGLLYHSRADFGRKAARINGYLRDWGAVGFRSAFMLHKLDWLHALNIRYDASTFDTDPFEPQPDGRHTIFPFWVPRPEANGASAPVGTDLGYVELPYTLPQDSTLFLLLREANADIWRNKLDWIASHGGMALVNIHPDYIDFGPGAPVRNTYPAARLHELFAHVTEKHAGTFWNPCAGELADWFSDVRRRQEPPAPSGSTNGSRPAALSRPNLGGKRAAVLLYSYYPADPRPRRAAESLASAGMEVDLVCLREEETDPPREMIRGVSVQRLPWRKQRAGKLTYLRQYSWFLVSAFGFLMRRGWGKTYDLIHVHNMPDVLVFAACVQKLRGARVILDLHDPMPELMTSIYGLPAEHWLVRALRRLEGWSIRFADLALTPNITFRNLFISRSCRPEKMGIVMNSPEGEIFDPARFAPDDELMDGSVPATDDGGGEFRLMHHGSIVSRHGLDLLVEAVARVRVKIPGVRLDIYGSRTPFLDTVLELAARLGIADAVHYHGAKSQPEIARAIRDCHLGVVPNRRSAFTEINFPTRLFEYLAMSRPVLAPATRGIRDYFGADQLPMFEPDDVDDLAAQILWVRANPAAVRELVARGREVYRQNLWRGEQARYLDHVAALMQTTA